MKLKEFIKVLEGLNPELEVLLASDEEQNTLFSDIRAIKYDESGELVLFGCSGSEVE